MNNEDKAWLKKAFSNKITKIILLSIICMFSTAIATFISHTISNVYDELDIARIFEYAWSIRWACLLFGLYFILGNKEH